MKKYLLDITGNSDLTIGEYKEIAQILEGWNLNPVSKGEVGVEIEATEFQLLAVKTEWPWMKVEEVR